MNPMKEIHQPKEVITELRNFAMNRKTFDLTILILGDFWGGPIA